ncbi:Pls/PosA family non-ribosomal peptide synthetase [Methylovirgula sp. HY1]|uniref:Pls/PosA family non-ribosomal peptide synthetase n=1 Tax=Methylovirgula sp. HY1 TaxID=2822761 RepID=UPI001C5BBCF8|nr:Pls/PosA family non-ribosomal peptide synthetase [Methylovirgula sp. HY1]QXX73463.1 Dimodular nonribosomal peptide synthase [Methylovirgula sp. HY1]
MYSAVRALNPNPIPARPARVLRGSVRPDLLRDELLCEIFAASARARPDGIALITAGGKLTYAEVDRRAEALARGLVRQGIGPGHVVGLWLPRGCELLISQIAIAKTGAAWLPFDADAPIDRIATCLADAEATALLTGGPRAETARAKPACPVLTAADLVDATDQTPVDARALGATPDHPAYLIYTSGSTGTPKGIAISGRNICHFLRAANEIYKLTDGDTMFQGASVAFDLSMEEIWLPYLVGATLFVASPEVMGETDRLPEVLEANGVTVLDTVPTLLSVLPRDIAGLRLIILGGEACPPTLAAQWCRPGRKIFNSYGPTETSVVATIAEVRIGETVTIGTPIPNYTCYVIDAGLGLLGAGEEGELLIGGPGVAKGYLRRPALTAQKFIANPFADMGGDPVLYRSGDAVIIDQQGNLLFRGRIDDQVKIRGFRVELGEIEAKLCECAGIENAAVVLRQHDGLDELTAFIVPTRGASLDSKLLRSELRAALPAYMVPARFEILAALPTLVSGKVDRNSLKKLELVPLVSAEAQEEPRNEIEAVLLAAAKRVLPPQSLPFDADFFTDLGGHSLLAARFVSLVRETPRLAGITLQDVYAARSLRAIAALLQGKARSGDGDDLSFTPPPWRRRFLCGLAQLAAMPFILSLIAVQWLGVFMSYMLFSGVDATLTEEFATLLAVYVAIELGILAIVIAAKWLLLGRTKPGRYPLWGVYFYRWWLAERLLSLIPIKTFQGTPIMRFYLRALGAKIGKDVLIGDLSCGAYDLIAIGDRACLGANAIFANARVEGNELIIGTIEIGADAQLGSSCVVEENVVIGEGAELLDLTAVPAESRIGAFEIWDGSPATKTGDLDPAALTPFAPVGQVRKTAMATIYAILLLAVPPLTLIPIFAGFWAFNRIDDLIGVADVDKLLYLASIPMISWPTAFVMVLVTVGFIIAFRWLVLPKVTEGTYSVHSWFFLRKWAVGLASEATLDTLSSLYATIYMRVWYRLMGAKIGKGAEISTNFAGRYDLVEIGEKCFIADEVVMGDEEIRRGYMILKRVKTGPRVFIGNSAVVPPGADIPANALIGIKSKPPANEMISSGGTWFGSPPIKLPVRQTFDIGSAGWTYEPPYWKKFARACFEAVTISLPTMLFITFGTWAVEWFGPALLEGAYGELAWRFVAAAVMISSALCAVVVALKWITMGRYEPVMKPMWSWWAMRTEAVAVIYAGLAGRMLLEHLRGTPFLPWIWRLLGAKVGRGVFVDMTDITEFDCVSIGDFSALNAGSALQTHLYEDRVMKVGRVKVEKGVTVGAGSTVLYDTVVADYARLGPLTVVMKGENIPAHSEWVGSPAQPKAAAMAPEARAAA